MRITRIDLNCDMGESSEPAVWSLEQQILPSLTSISIACGWHAGSPEVMRRLVRAAKASGVHVGAHPGYRDRVGMGRREVNLSSEEIENLIAYQTAALAGVAALEGLRLSHVKPHGALYHRAARDPIVADAIVRAAAAVDPRLSIFAMPGSRLIHAARDKGLAAVEEAFADRAYQADGTLAPRGRPGALLVDEPAVRDQVLKLVRDGRVPTIDGAMVSLSAETLCLHVDTPGAVRLALIVRQTLEECGVHVAPSGSR